jgi:hypothetical protein
LVKIKGVKNMLIKLKEDNEKFNNWENEFDSDQNAFLVLGIQSQSEYVEINEKKITVIVEKKKNGFYSNTPHKPLRTTSRTKN